MQKNKNGFSNIKLIESRYATLETPNIFPVHNAGSRGTGNSPEYWKEIPDMTTMMLNAYYIKNSTIFEPLVQEGLHKYFQMNGTFFIDSGGLQSRLYGHSINPLEILRIQEKIGADIASTLDIPILSTDSIFNNQNTANINTTIKNALFCLEKREIQDMHIYASLQGNNLDILSNIINYLNSRGNFDGYALGGMSLQRSDYRTLIDFIVAVRSKIGDKPLHIFGIGGLLYIPLLVYLGVDTFDSSSFMTAGSNRIYFVPDEGSREFKELEKIEYLPCTCPICSKNKAEIIRKQRNLIAMHNLWAITYELRRLKYSILDNRLEEYLEHRFYANPSMMMAYKYAKIKVSRAL